MKKLYKYTTYLIPAGIFMGLVTSFITVPYNPWKSAFFGYALFYALKDLVKYMDEHGLF